MVTTNLRFSDMIGAVCDVDGETWLKGCLGIGATTLLVRLVKTHLEKKAYWARYNLLPINYCSTKSR